MRVNLSTHLRLHRAFLFLCAAWVIAVSGVRAEWSEHRDSAMTTDIVIRFWRVEGVDSHVLIDAAMAEFKRIEYAYSAYRESNQLDAVNRQAAQFPVVVSAELFGLFDQAVSLSRLTGGAFDITFHSVGWRYDFRRGVRPPDSEREALQPSIDFRHLLLDAGKREIHFLAPDVKVGLGGIAKGHAVERVTAILRDHGIASAQITAGGDSRFVGDHRGRPWSIGVRDPRREGEIVAVVPVIDEAVSTSGDYQRYFVEDGIRYHHILDPATGDSSRELRSVTIIGPDAVQTDGLSTGIFVMGVAAGLALIESLEGYEAVIIDGLGTLHFSSGLSAAD